MQTIAATPAHEAMRRNSLLRGMSRRKIQHTQYHADSRNSSVPRPTMTSHARWTVLTCEIVGRSSRRARVSRPWTTVLVPSLGSDSHEASPGIRIPPVTSPSALSRPSSVSGTSLSVSGTSSMAANLIGWLLYTQRASESPTPIWIGMAMAPTVNGMRNPRRW